MVDAEAAAPPAVPVTSWGEKEHPVWLYRFLQILLGPLARFLFRVKRIGVKSIPKKGAVILASNHVSNIDPVLVVLSMRRTVFHLGKHTLFTHWFGRWFFGTLGGQIPVDRDRGDNTAALAAANRVLARGHAMGLYPEGGRSPDGIVCRGRTGVARLAVTSGAPVYPVAIEGTLRVWPKGKKFPRLFRRVRIIVGPPRVYPRDPEAVHDVARMRAITDEIMGDLAKLLGQSYDPAKARLLRSGDD